LPSLVERVAVQRLGLCLVASQLARARPVESARVGVQERQVGVQLAASELAVANWFESKQARSAAALVGVLAVKVVGRLERADGLPPGRAHPAP